jgi:LPXTG-motif cell wall-anchored protein
LLKRLFLTALAIAALAFVPQANTLTAKAATTTFTVKYLPSYSEWRVQPLSTWDEPKGTGDLGYLYSNVKDGDIIVIVGDSDSPALKLSIGAKISNLTIYGAVNGVTYETTSEVTDAYVLKGSIASLSGYYKNVYVYDTSSCNTFNNVDHILACKESSMTMNISAVGTVGQFQFVDNGNVTKTIYNITANALRVVNGELKTDAANYSLTATGTTTPSKTSTGTATGTATNNGASVSPKTGESSYAILLFAGAIFCFAGAFVTRKKIAR